MGGVLGPEQDQYESLGSAMEMESQLTDILLPLHHHPKERDERRDFRRTQRASADRPHHSLAHIVHQQDRRCTGAYVVHTVGMNGDSRVQAYNSQQHVESTELAGGEACTFLPGTRWVAGE